MALADKGLQWVTAVPDSERQASRGRICGVLAVSRTAMLRKSPCKARKLCPALCTSMSVALSLQGRKRMEHKHEPSGSPGLAPGFLAACPRLCCMGTVAPRTTWVASLFHVQGQPSSLTSLGRGEAVVPGETSHDFSRAVA